MVAINSKVFKLIVNVSKPKLAKQFGLFQYCLNNQSRFISSAYAKMTYKAPRPLIVSGPSGSGKGTLLKRLAAEFPETFGFTVSHTTRPPRPGEIDGVHYHFVKPGPYTALIAKNEFLEHAIYGGEGYGTSKETVKNVQDTGKVCVLEIDIEGIKQVRYSDLDAIYVFIMPPSIEELRRRLTERGTEDSMKIEQRLRRAKKEIDYAQTQGKFDKVILNENLEDAYAELRDFVVKELEKQKEDGAIISLKRAGDD